MAKLYLIRRNLETFAGPMTSAELKDAYKRMAFGLQDEVSGHCGPWVTFDDLPNVRKYYPEIARIVHEDAMQAWGVSSEHGMAIIKNVGQPEEGAGGQGGLWVALTFLGLALGAFILAIYFATGGRLAGRARDSVAEPTPSEAQGFLDRGDMPGFERYMASHLESVVDKITFSKRFDPQWLPYMRLYAFNQEGTINGLAPKTLRGEGATSAPVDCSLRAWRRRWRSSVRNWGELASEKRLVRTHWSRLLAWDPYWVRRRDNKGWIRGSSYYLGCVTMSERALSEIMADTALLAQASEADRLGGRQFVQRLDWLLEILRDGQPSAASTQASLQLTGGLGTWSCFEAARDLKELIKCRGGEGSPSAEDDPWAAYNDERFGWNLLRLAMQAKGSPPADLTALLNQYGNKMSRGDFFTRFDYRFELKVWRMLQKQPGPMDKIMEKAQSDFPEIKL
jgi:hypothetical protein